MSTSGPPHSCSNLPGQPSSPPLHKLRNVGVRKQNDPLTCTAQLETSWMSTLWHQAYPHCCLCYTSVSSSKCQQSPTANICAWYFRLIHCQSLAVVLVSQDEETEPRKRQWLDHRHMGTAEGTEGGLSRSLHNPTTATSVWCSVPCK